MLIVQGTYKTGVGVCECHTLVDVSLAERSGEARRTHAAEAVDVVDAGVSARTTRARRTLIHSLLTQQALRARRAGAAKRTRLIVTRT